MTMECHLLALDCKGGTTREKGVLSGIFSQKMHIRRLCTLSKFS